MGSEELFCKTYSRHYEKSSEDIRCDLMLLNCFEVDGNGAFRPNGKLAFPFYNVDSSPTKSIEHIQCQNPAGSGAIDRIDKIVEDLKTYRANRVNIHDWFFTVLSAKRILLCSDYYKEEAAELNKVLSSPSNKDILETADKLENDIDFMPEDNQWEKLAVLYMELLDIHFKRFGLPLSKLRPKTFVDVNTECLHSIGNLALVTGSLNSAFLNRTFTAKRKVLRDKINAGETVPPHTFNVFSKMSGLGSHTDCWCAEDAASNAADTLAQLYKLRKALQSADVKGGEAK